MVPEVAAGGWSFKGAFAYYLHDKNAQTAERVAWVETRNLAHDDPAYAQSVMIATARQADALKRAAGVKATGSKKKVGPVMAYSLSWHPDKEDTPDRAEMIRAAEMSIKALGAGKLQAVIIAHQDTPHPHVHVVLNRVDPNDGRQFNVNDWQKLSSFRKKYEKERGQIVTQTAEQKAEKIAAWRAEKAAPQQAFTAAAAVASTEPVTPKPKSRAAMLAEEQAAQKDRHRQEWADLAATNKTRRAAVYAERTDFKAIAADHRAAAKPHWSKLGKVQAAERRAFHEREKRLSGIVRNAIAAARSQQKRGVADDRGFLTMAVAYAVSGKARRAVFDAHQQGRKNDLAAILERDLLAKFDAVKAGRGGKLEAVRKTYDDERAALIERQDLEKAQIRDEWKRIYAEREKLARHAGRSRDRMTRQNPQNYRYGRRAARAARSAPIDNQAKPAPTIAEVIDATAVPSPPALDPASQLAETKQSPDLGKDFLDRAREPAATPAQEAAAQQSQTAGQIRRAWAAVKEMQKTTAAEGGQQEQGQSAARKISKARSRSRVRTRGKGP